MSAIDVRCWHCGGSIEHVLLPLSRTEECPHCGRDLHVCRMCRFYDPAVSNACREPVAERVTDKTRANFCGYLEINVNADPAAAGAGSAEALNSLFGIDTSAADGDPKSLDDLFGLGGGKKD